jgi:Holliday junction resolvase
MSAGSRGSARERQVMAKLRADGWVVYRAAGSHGNADLVALRADMRPMLVQVKASQQGAYEHFGPEDRAALIFEAVKAGADAMLCHWPARGELRWIPSSLWPSGRKIARLVEASSGDIEHALRVADITEAALS